MEINANVSLSEQELVRREKLKKMVDEGKNPYAKTEYDVTAHSTDIIDNFNRKYYFRVW